MNEARLPDLTLKIRRRDSRNVLTIENRFNDNKVGPKKLPEIHEHRVTTARIVEAFKQEAKSQSPRGVANALTLLEQQLGRISSRFIGVEAREEIKQVLKHYKDVYRERPPLIVVDCGIDEFLPIELLALTGFGKGTDDLDDLASRFVGFSCIVKREFPDSPGPKQSVMYGKRPRIRFFCDEALKGARQEGKFFERNSEALAVTGPWPTTNTSSQTFIQDLTVLLCWANGTANSGTPMDDIQHFSCHCDTADISGDSQLRMTNKLTATIDEIADELWKLPDYSSRNPGPLVFINACGSSRVIPMGSTSFPKFFIGADIAEFYNLGFIGSEANLPDTFAAEFAERFYYHFLEEGLKLGYAMHKAKWAMLQKRRNPSPLGLLYTVFANPHLHVAQPVKGLKTKYGR